MIYADEGVMVALFTVNEADEVQILSSVPLNEEDIMKVKIGTYWRWWTTSSLLSPFKHILSEERYVNLVKFIEKNTALGRFLVKKTYGIERKEFVRIDDSDVWNMYYTLALIIHPMLVKLSEKKHGSPSVDNADVPDELHRPTDKSSYEIDDKYHDRWDHVLKEMIFAFGEIINPDREHQFYSGESDIRFEKVEGSDYFEMKRGPNDTFEVDRESQKAYEDRIQNGLRLFGKYYQNLWD